MQLFRTIAAALLVVAANQAPAAAQFKSAEQLAGTRYNDSVAATTEMNAAKKTADGEYKAADDLITEQYERLMAYQYDVWDAAGPEGYAGITGHLDVAYSYLDSGNADYEWGDEERLDGAADHEAGNTYYAAGQWQDALSAYNAAVVHFVSAEYKYQAAADEYAEAYAAALAAKNWMDALNIPAE